MDNPLITTVNKNFELAMAKYSSITGQLEEVRRRIFGSESEPIKTEQKDTHTGSPLKEKRVVNTRSSERSSEQESTFEKSSEGKSSLLTPSSEESIGQVAVVGRTAIEPQTSESNPTLTNSMKDSTSESLENMFGELFKNLKNKPKNLRVKSYESSSEDDSVIDEEDTMSSSSENEKNIENLFLQEINKIPSNIKNSEELKTKQNIENKLKSEESEELEINDFKNSENYFGTIKRSDSTKSIISENKISYENIFNSEPLDIMTILEEKSVADKFIKGSVDSSKNIIEDKIFDLYEDDVLSVKTKMSILDKLSKKKKSSRKASSIRQKSRESNINSLINDLKSIKSKSIHGDGKKKVLTKNDSKFKKNIYPNARYLNVNKNIKNGINKEIKIKNNEKQGQSNKFCKQTVTAKRDCVKQVKTKTACGKTIENSTCNLTKSIQFQGNGLTKSKVNERNDLKNISNKSVLDKNIYPERIINKEEIKKVYKAHNFNTSQNTINKNLKKFPSKNIEWCAKTTNSIENENPNEQNIERCTEKKNEIILSSAKEILTKIEQQIVSEKLNNEIKDIKKCDSAEAFRPTILKKVSLNDKFNDTNPKICKSQTGTCKANKTYKGKVITSRYMPNVLANVNKEEDNIFSSDKREVIKNEKSDELQKDGANNNKLVPKKSLIKSFISKNDLPNCENNQIVKKSALLNEPTSEIHNEILTTNIDEKKSSIHFPFILGRSASKSFNIQANIQQITSLVRMLPKESIQRTLLEENEVASRISIKTSEGKCPACNEKETLCESSDFTSKDDPWDNSNGHFVRCTCMFKNTISSKLVLEQLMFQTNSCQFPLSSETSFTQFEECADKNTINNEGSINLAKRHDLTKLLHVTQRFVNII